MKTGWNSARMLELGRQHALLEERRELDALMGTLVKEPVYEFYPIGLRMVGGHRVRRYYAQFFANFMQRIVGYELLDEWVNPHSLVQEYDIALQIDGPAETHRVVGVLYAKGEVLGGERIYASERLVRLMAGEMLEELESLEPR